MRWMIVVALATGCVSKGRYELLEEVGAGASGVVYRAHDRRLDQRVAIKLLHDPREDADRERCIFVQFGKGSVSHYRVVQLYRCDLRSEITLGLG